MLTKKKPTKNATHRPEIEYFSVFCPDVAKESLCYALNVCLSPQIICWNPKSYMVVLLGGAFGKCLSRNAGALMNGFMAPWSLLFQPPACMHDLSHIQLLVVPWILALQASLSMGSPGKNTGVGCRALLQGILNLSLTSPASARGFLTTSASWEALNIQNNKFLLFIQAT